MRRLFALGTAVAAACTSFGGSSDAPATTDGGATSADASAVGAEDGGAPSVDSAAAAACTGGCPSNAVCDDGVCLLTACTSDGGVVLLRPERLVDSKGAWTTFPAGAAIVDTVHDHGNGDDDTSRAEVAGSAPMTLRIGSDLFKLPANRSIASVVVRARGRTSAPDGGPGGGGSLVLRYHFRSFDGVFSQIPMALGSGYGIVQFALANHPFPTYAPPYDASANGWTEDRVNDVDIDLDVAIDAGTTFRLTQLWVEVCLAATQ